MGLRRTGALAASLLFLGALIVLGVTHSLPSVRSATGSAAKPTLWATQHRVGTVAIKGEVPLVVANRKASLVGHHSANAELTLSFGLPIVNRSTLDKLIAYEAGTHRYLSRAQLYKRFSPPKAQLDALGDWLQSNGFRITHVGRDRLALAATATTANVEKTLGVKINDYIRPGSTFRKLKVAPYTFYANTNDPKVPARFGLQTIAGLSDVDRFFTNVQLAKAAGNQPIDCGQSDDGDDSGDDNGDGGGVINPLCVDVRGGGYFPTDLRGLYDVAGHGYDGTGQTIGFTLWTVPERQAAMTKFATDTGDTLITVDPSCVATGNSPTSPSSCSAKVVAPDHLLFILENGNSDTTNNFGSNVETALDIEAAHGVATGVAMKYYASECATNPPPNTGLANANCNGTDVGMEMAMEDAANDPTLHSVSNSWGYGGEAEWGLTDPFVVTTSNILQFAAAAGTSFYFSTGDAGTYQSGYPTDSPYVVSVGGTSTYSTSSPGTWSTSTTWSGSGSWCSNIIARPSWQTGPGLANASCPGRVSPDVSAVADPSTGVRFTNSTSLTGGTQSGSVGGTSLAAPVMNGLQADTQSFIAAQSYPGTKPKMGFVSPMLYQLGNSPNYQSYFRDIQCGNTANPTSGPDGDAATSGWDPATGWGEPDWFNFATGYAIALGATNLSQPASLSQHFSWRCAQTPSNSTERAISCPSSTCYAVGSPSGGTPWYGKFLPSGAWGAVNTFFKSTDGGATWFPSNSDMFSIACTSGTTCTTVGAGGRERQTTDGGVTWTDVPTAPGNNKPLTQIACPSSSICYAAGDRGNVMKSTDGGQTWSWLSSTDGNPIYGLSCPDTSTCYATDIYAHVIKTTDGGATWEWQQTPITTPYAPVVAETGGPNPWGGMTGISCPSVTTCVGVGIYATVTGQTNPIPDPPIVTTTDGGATWTRQVSGTGTGNFLQAVSCLPGTTTCTAVGRGGKIVTTTNLTTWTAATSNTTSYLNSVLCLSTSFCIAVGQTGTVDVFNGATWTATTGNGGTGTLADVDCSSNLVCYATGKQGVTIMTTNGGTSWTVQAGGGTTQQMNGISCTSDTACFAAGNAGTILKTTNGGQAWTTATSGTTTNLSAISCFQANGCAAVGAAAGGAAVVRFTNDGTNWNAAGNTGSQALNGVSCLSGGRCLAVGAAGTAISSSSGGSSWSPTPTGTTNALNAVSCPSSNACYAVGAGGTVLKFPNVASGPSPQTSNTTQSLSGVACVTDAFCVADGAVGTTVVTSDGSTWGQQGNPLSGPTTAINATNIALNGAGCNAGRCLIGLGAQGDILGTPLVTVTIHGSSVYGSTPNLSFSPSDAALSYSPTGEAGNVTGTLTCTSTVTPSSPVGSYPIASCSGLADDGFNIVYDTANSSYAVTKAPLTVTADNKSRLFGQNNPPLTATLSGFVLGQNLATSGVTGQASCTTNAMPFSPTGAYGITCTQGTLAAANYSFGPFVPGTLSVTSTGPCLSGTHTGPLTVKAGQAICTMPGVKLTGPLTIDAGGAIDLTGATVSGPVRASGATVVRICGSALTGPLSISESTSLVLVGGDAATGPCAGNTITGPVTISGNTGGVEFNSNRVTGPVRINGNTGSVPPPDSGPVHATGNIVTGPSQIQ